MCNRQRRQLSRIVKLAWDISRNTQIWHSKRIFNGHINRWIYMVRQSYGRCPIGSKFYTFWLCNINSFTLDKAIYIRTYIIAINQRRLESKYWTVNTQIWQQMASIEIYIYMYNLYKCVSIISFHSQSSLSATRATSAKSSPRSELLINLINQTLFSW